MKKIRDQMSMGAIVNLTPAEDKRTTEADSSVSGVLIRAPDDIRQ